MNGWLAIGFLIVAVAGLLLWGAWMFGDPATRRDMADGEVELHRIRRSMQAAELKREIRRDAQFMRIEVRRELREIEQDIP